MDDLITIPLSLYDDLRTEARNHEIIMDALSESAYTVSEGKIFFDYSLISKVLKICFPVQYRYLVNKLEFEKAQHEEDMRKVIEHE